jgi:hypothetical protein
MTFLKKPDPHKIYRKELPKINTEGPKSKKLTTFQIIKNGILDIEMEPKEYHKYDTIKYEFKVYLFTFLIAFGMFYTVVHSSITSGPIGDDKETWFDTMLDDVLNFLADQWDNLVTKIQNLF